MPKLFHSSTAIVALIAAAAAASPAMGQSTINESGELRQGDETLDTGEFSDVFYFEGRAGETVDAQLDSNDFDTYLLLRGPDEFSTENDDDEASQTTNSRIRETLPSDGTYRLIVTSYEPGEEGSYDFRANLGRSGRVVSGGGGNALAIGVPTSGELGGSDPQLESGEYFDSYTLNAPPGAQVQIRMQSSSFDTYLAAFGAGDLELSNDDDASGASGTNSLLEATVPSDGRLTVAATSYAGGETGAYTLTATLRGGASRQAAANGQNITLGQSANGALSASDPRGDTSFEDTYLLQASAGQSVRLALSSSAFDTVLRIEGPNGFSTENDDDPSGSTLNSLVETQLPAAGTYRVVVASYDDQGLGAYTLETSGSTRAASNNTGTASSLAVGRQVSGSLATNDETIPTGEFFDAYTFQGTRGQRVSFDMTSSEFDTYLALLFPGGGQEANDDATEGNTNSRLTVTLPADGTYQLVATSYQEGETGQYALSMNADTRVAAAVDPRRGSSRVFALSVGVSDYGGRAGNLSMTDQDATKLTQTLQASGMLASQSVTLVNRQATRDNFVAAIDDIAANIGPDDLFLLFFSGHGSKQAVPRYMERDGTSETIELFDHAVTDLELAQMIDPIHARTLLVLDSCFSGGFDDVVERGTGRMGVFSSDSDLTSLVASKFEAGGYISHILQQALEGRADANGDSSITAGELSEYMRNTFYQIALADPLQASTYGAGGSRAQGYQHIVVNRGGDGMGYEEVLLNLGTTRVSQSQMSEGATLAFAD